MLQFTRTHAATILTTVPVICALSLLNFVPEKTIASWPEWAQRRITLSPELQGGTSVLLEVDQDRLREYLLRNLFSEARGVLRDAHIHLASPTAIRSNGIEVKPLAGDFENALLKLRALSRAFNGVHAAEVTDAGGGLIRVTPTEASVQEYEPSITHRSIGEISARLFGIPATIEREGAWRIRVQVPRLGSETLKRPVT